jgi:hypothetical protein
MIDENANLNPGSHAPLFWTTHFRYHWWYPAVFYVVCLFNRAAFAVMWPPLHTYSNQYQPVQDVWTEWTAAPSACRFMCRMYCRRRWAHTPWPLMATLSPGSDSSFFQSPPGFSFTSHRTSMLSSASSAWERISLSITCSTWCLS